MGVIKDKNSIEWMRVQDHCNRRLKSLREDNERDLDPVETATLRGMIRMANEILALDSDEKVLEKTETANYY